MSTKSRKKGYSYPEDFNPYETNPCKPQGPHDCTRAPDFMNPRKNYPNGDEKERKKESKPNLIYVARRREKMRKRTNNNVNET